MWKSRKNFPILTKTTDKKGVAIDKEATSLLSKKKEGTAVELTTPFSKVIPENSENVKKKDAGLWQTIKNAVMKILKKWGVVIDAYKDKHPEAAEAGLLEKIDVDFKKLQKMFAEAFADASDTYNAVGDIRSEVASQSSSKEFARDIDKKRKSTHNEFASLAMRWAKQADRKSGDVTIFYNGKQKAFVAIRAIAGEYYTLAIGNYEEVRESYERVYSQNDRGINGYIDQFRSYQGSGLWNLQYDEDGEDGGRNRQSLGSAGVQVDSAGNLEYLWGRYRGKSIRRSADFGGALWQTDLMPLLRRFGEEWHGTTIGARRYGRVGNKVVAIEKIAENAFEVVDVYRVENNNEEAGFIVSAMVEDLNESPDESVAMVFADHKVGDPTPFITKFNTKSKEFGRKLSDRGEQQDRGRGVREGKSDLRGNGKVKLHERDLVGYERQRKIAAALAADKAHLSEDVETHLRALLDLQSKRTYGTHPIH